MAGELAVYTSTHLPLVTHTQLWGTPNAATVVKCPKERTDISKCLFNLLAAGWHLKTCYLTPRPIPGGERLSVFAFGSMFSHGRGQLAGETPCAQEWLCIATPLFGRGGCGVPAAVLGSSQGLLLKVLRPVSKSFMSPRLAQEDQRQVQYVLGFTSCLFQLN